ncbi:MAG: hypothetical protein JRG68_07820 [Deltaproteobacteria bacterium]|nr:hypothetical protein [Deltaproteobacteria bacterium]
MSLAYEITSEKDSIIIRLSRQSVDQEALEKLLDYIELESIRRRSQLTEQDSATLASEIKQAAWQKVKNLFEE